jgi:NADP-dependent 3-hydroxy acid dehydrogenase YdfG
MSETTEPAPLTEREMNQFITLATLPTLERALERLRWLEAELAALKANDPLNDAVNQACDELPDQWQVVVYLERNAGCVELVHPNFHQEDVHEDETSVSDLVREAIRRAKEGQR